MVQDRRQCRIVIPPPPRWKKIIADINEHHDRIGCIWKSILPEYGNVVLRFGVDDSEIHDVDIPKPLLQHGAKAGFIWHHAENKTISDRCDTVLIQRSLFAERLVLETVTVDGKAITEVAGARLELS